MARAEAIYACKLKHKSNINNTARRKVCNWFLIFAKRAPCERGRSLSLLPDCPVSWLPAPAAHTPLIISHHLRSPDCAQLAATGRPVLSAFVLLPTAEPETEISHFTTFPLAHTHTPTSRHLHICYTHTHMQRELICITCKWEVCRATKGSPRNEK